ncbi:type II toxin-antitoxin system VapC family toxin [Nocardioides sp. Kera G14]|uniref:type II toxin-antitoxin system VapC family toxin n=1 Tax=Nocardioides sp. Kera G14 TaxID=2884264 RepID=UPI001D12F494|nr:PIN domain-containing protein [Nocardioides sp. Kera G14]UDY25046.1 PIN domain-containing protein [Nocardioides sp. Kera G14]
MILVDSGPLIAAAIRKQPANHPCVEMFTGLRLARRRLLVPATVAAEVGFMLEKLGGTRAETAFLRALGQRDFTAVDLTPTDYSRMAELVGQYDDLPLGTTDASVIALAERLGITEIATLDRRHFTAVRPRHVEAFSLFPERL